MSVERLLGKKLESFRANDSENPLDLFKKSISEKNIKVQDNSRKYNFTPALISGAIAGSLIVLILEKHISNKT